MMHAYQLDLSSEKAGKLSFHHIRSSFATFNLVIICFLSSGIMESSDFYEVYKVNSFKLS